jgi:hypothetical protein
MAMGAMGTEYGVTILEVDADPGGDRFLADAEVNRAFDLLIHVHGVNALLEESDGQHGSE